MKDIKAYRTGFSFRCLSHAPGLGHWGTKWAGVKKSFFLKLNQIWCVSFSHEWHTQRRNIFGLDPAPWALRWGEEGQISLNLNRKSISKIFKPSFVCHFTNEREKTYQMGFSFGCLGHAQWVGLWGTLGVGESKKYFPKFNQIYCLVHAMAHNFGVPTFWGLREGPKGQISLNLNHKVNLKEF